MPEIPEWIAEAVKQGVLKSKVSDISLMNDLIREISASVAQKKELQGTEAAKAFRRKKIIETVFAGKEAVNFSVIEFDKVLKSAQG